MRPLPFKDLEGRIVLPSPGAWVDCEPEDWPHDPVPQDELDAIGYVPEDAVVPVTEEQLHLPDEIVDDFGVEALEDDED